MSVERTTQGIRISTIYKGKFVSMHYIFYTKREAIREFKQHLKTLS